jgi:predicted DNA-binding protein (UPF0251 family)
MCRRVRFTPSVTYYKPAGVRMTELEEVVLLPDELEALRLKDALGMEQDPAAKQMGVSQPTFHRILASARKKVSEALIKGKALRITTGEEND